VDAAQSAKILGVSITPSSASQRLSGRIWFVGLGAFAPESLVRSASRPYPGPFDSRSSSGIRGPAPERQRTAVATMLPPCLRVRFWFLLWPTRTSALRPRFFDSRPFSGIRGSLQNGRGLPLLQRPLCASAPLRLCASAPLRLCASAPPRLRERFWSAGRRIRA
jgi:hypothetical protein